jgi:hypothetical protein
LKSDPIAKAVDRIEQGGMSEKNPTFRTRKHGNCVLPASAPTASTLSVLFFGK